MHQPQDVSLASAGGFNQEISEARGIVQCNKTKQFVAYYAYDLASGKGSIDIRGQKHPLKIGVRITAKTPFNTRPLRKEAEAKIAQAYCDIANQKEPS